MLNLIKTLKSTNDNTVKYIFESNNSILEFSYIDKCDGKDIFTCTSCGMIAVYNVAAELYLCKTCKYTSFTKSRITTSTITYENYLEALGITIKRYLEAPKFMSE